VQVGDYWRYVLKPTGLDPLVGSDGFDPLGHKKHNGPQLLKSPLALEGGTPSISPILLMDDCMGNFPS
jgi:hypothetical protein